MVAAAEAALERRKYVTPLDVLIGIGWLPPNPVEAWRQGRGADLGPYLQVSFAKAATALDILADWARGNGLTPSETEYLSAIRDRRRLRFTADGDPEVERVYRTHWLSPAMSPAQRKRVTERQNTPPDLVVMLPVTDWSCTGCGGTGDMLIMENAGPSCLTCADMDHLIFLPAGDAALTRRAKKESGLSAVVLRWNRARKRYQRQGLLVDERALDRAEEQCLADEDVRARRRERDRERRAVQDLELEAEMVRAIGRLFPGCPAERAEAIARHTAARGSGRVGRSAAGRALDDRAIMLAVVASVRHEDTGYDDLLMSGVPRDEARDRIGEDIDRVLAGWTT